jgi:hypothetical protein
MGGAVFLRQQQFWVDILNLAATGGHDADPESLLRAVLPPEHGDFPDPPGWNRRRTAVWLANWLDVLRAAFEAVENGSRPDTEPLNLLLSEGELRLGPDEPGALMLRVRDRSANPATTFVHDLVLRAAHFLGQYLSYRQADPAWPDASPERFVVRRCLREDCGKLFVRTPRATLYCSDACAGRDAATGG